MNIKSKALEAARRAMRQLPNAQRDQMLERYLSDGIAADKARIRELEAALIDVREQAENWRHDSEDLEALHHNLDDAGVPRYDSAGIEYSAWGRVIQYAKAAAPRPAPDVAGLVTALEDIDQWVSRWASADHPVAKAARKALATYSNQEGES